MGDPLDTLGLTRPRGRRSRPPLPGGTPPAGNQAEMEHVCHAYRIPQVAYDACPSGYRNAANFLAVNPDCWGDMATAVPDGGEFLICSP